MELEQRRSGGVDHTWNNVDNKMLGRALGDDRWDYILALYLGRFAGLRIHECFRIDTATAEQALRENAIMIKGTGGKVRMVPIEGERTANHLEKQLERTPRGHKLLVPDGMPTDRAINQLQFFICSNRDDFQEDASRPLTFHGLRHTYAVEKYQN